MKDRKLIVYARGRDELMKLEIMKERDKGFLCLIQVMICDKVWSYKTVSYCSGYDMQKAAI